MVKQLARPATVGHHRRRRPGVLGFRGDGDHHQLLGIQQPHIIESTCGYLSRISGRYRL